jgi:hypothetical protein
MKIGPIFLVFPSTPVQALCVVIPFTGGVKRREGKPRYVYYRGNQLE